MISRTAEPLLQGEAKDYLSLMSTEKLNLSSSQNSFKLRNETILKEVTDCGKAARDFIAG